MQLRAGAQVAQSVRSWIPLRGQVKSGKGSVRRQMMDSGVMHARSRGLAALEELQEEKKAEEMDSGTVPVDRIVYDRPLSVVSYPDPRLRFPNAKIKLPATGVEDLAKGMFEIMYNDDGIGLAAPQVGVNVQMMVFNPEGHPARGDKSKETVLINPQIIKTGKETEIDEEGCLSFYHPVYIAGDVERATTVKVKALDLEGNRVTLTLTGLVARIFQHEFDHLKGVLFFERMSPAVLDSVRADLKRYEEEFIQENPNVSIQRFFP